MGTSATLSTEGDYESRQKRLAKVSSRLFGALVEAPDIIGETLQRVTPEQDMADAGFVAELTEAVSRAQPPTTPEGFVADPLSGWIESLFGIRHEDDRLVRAVPLPITGPEGAAKQLSTQTGLDETVCEEAIRAYLLAGNSVERPDTGNPVFPFRLHQFISRGDTVYASPEPSADRYLSLSGERFVPDSKQQRVLLPLAFCRECGQDYYVAHRQPTNDGSRLIRRDINDNEKRDSIVPGFLYVSDDDPWPEDPVEADKLLPAEWSDPKTRRLRSSRRDHVPQRVRVGSDGSLGQVGGMVGWWTEAPFRFCLACGVSYSITRSNDFARLSTLGAGGRASATTIMSLTAVRQVLSYRLYGDLKRGWRITQPNLEQVGLLEIDYKSRLELANDQETWDDCDPALAASGPELREHVLRVLLDSIRRELGLKVKVLNRHEQESLRLRAGQRLTGSWSLEDDEKMESCTEVVTYPNQNAKQGRWKQPLTSRGLFGRFLRRSDVLGHHTLDETDTIIGQIVERLRRYGLLTQVGGEEEGRERWQIPAAALVWKAGDGTRAYRDHLRVTRAPDEVQTNTYFVDLYRNTGISLAGIEAREHTAQVSNEKRIEREERFRTAELPVLYCSPTMELGVDISKLNVVNMRNVPPTPANYAQRSGRAGRGGQPALVFTYCSSGNSHDQHFFREPTKMISGQVEAPRIDLANEDLLRAHVHALWLSESGLDLGTSMSDILDMGDDTGGKPALKPFVWDHLRNQRVVAKTRERALTILADLEHDLAGKAWWSQDWVDHVLSRIPARFEKALKRWTDLYMAALAQFREQNRIAVSPARSAQDQKAARRLRNEAERQLDVLRAKADHRG